MYNLPEYQRPENWEDMVEHHLYSVAPLSELSIDTLGPLPEDESGMRKIILIDNFSKFVGLHPATSTSTLEFVKSFLSGYFGGVEESQKRWRVSIHIQYGPSTQRHLEVSAHHRSTLPSSSKLNGREEDEGGVDTPQSPSV